MMPRSIAAATPREKLNRNLLNRFNTRVIPLFSGMPEMLMYPYYDPRGIAHGRGVGGREFVGMNCIIGSYTPYRKSMLQYRKLVLNSPGDWNVMPDAPPTGEMSAMQNEDSGESLQSPLGTDNSDRAFPSELVTFMIPSRKELSGGRLPPLKITYGHGGPAKGNFARDRSIFEVLDNGLYGGIDVYNLENQNLRKINRLRTRLAFMKRIYSGLPQHVKFDYDEEPLDEKTMLENSSWNRYFHGKKAVLSQVHRKFVKTIPYQLNPALILASRLREKGLQNVFNEIKNGSSFKTKEQLHPVQLPIPRVSK
jgi:hypothetical protein